jgi:hypothetical protein
LLAARFAAAVLVDPALDAVLRIEAGYALIWGSDRVCRTVPH